MEQIIVSHLGSAHPGAYRDRARPCTHAGDATMVAVQPATGVGRLTRA
jgi:hypothetical protein